MKRYPIPRPTEAAAIRAAASHPGPQVPTAVLLDRMAFCHRQQDRRGFGTLGHLLARAAGEVGER